MISTASFPPPWFAYQIKSWHMHKWYTFSSSQVPWQLLEREREQEIMVWSPAWREIYLHTDKKIYFSYFSFNFSCFEHIDSLPVISWFWKFNVPIWAFPTLGAHPYSESNFPWTQPWHKWKKWNNKLDHLNHLNLFWIFVSYKNSE